MRAAWYERNGKAREVLVVGELPTPEPAPGEVRVRLATSGVNPSDVKSRLARPLSDPRIVPHSDGAGIIDRVGAGVPESRIGERVWVYNGQWRRPLGTAAEYIALPAAQAVPLPAGVDEVAAACFGIPALTAFHAVSLFDDLAGKTLLITGASSAVGHYATQFAARERGARVIGTVGSEQKAAHARAAGAAETIDYKREDVAGRLQALAPGGVDGVVDMDFSSTAALLDRILKPRAQVVCYGSNTVDPVAVPFRPLLMNAITLRFFLVYDLLPDEFARGIAAINAMAGGGRLDHTVGARFPLDRIVEAHEAVEAGATLGNVVIDLN